MMIMDLGTDGRTGGRGRASDPVEYIVAVSRDDRESALTDVIDAGHRPRRPRARAARPNRPPAGLADWSVDTVSQTGRCRW